MDEDSGRHYFSETLDEHIQAGIARRQAQEPMKRIPEHIVQDIVSRTDIVRVVGEYVRLEKPRFALGRALSLPQREDSVFRRQRGQGLLLLFRLPEEGGDVDRPSSGRSRAVRLRRGPRKARREGRRTVVAYEGAEGAPAEVKAAKPGTGIRSTSSTRSASPPPSTVDCCPEHPRWQGGPGTRQGRRKVSRTASRRCLPARLRPG
ncbi:MAG: hypothetical protein MZU95_08445 [Desulfomicrobium escambiense]|nr:hypothetical protein [Desulfomicrobium escambiense]